MNNASMTLNSRWAIILCLLSINFFNSNGVQAQNELVRTFDASCSEICDGSAELMDFVLTPERYYLWMPETEGRYHSMNQPIIDGLCPGRYRVRKVDVSQEPLIIQTLADTSLDGFEGISEFEFHTKGKREVSFYLELGQEVNYLNYYYRSQYSVDGGITWVKSSQFHQKVLTEKGGTQHILYLMNLPSSSNEREMIKVRLYQRNSEEVTDRSFLDIKNAFLESKAFGEYVFQIGTPHNLRIRSSVSNELEGNDGYISIELQGGMPPYKCLWENGYTDLMRNNLAAGTYSVIVSDSKNCKEEARYVVLPPNGSEITGVFALERIGSSAIFELDVEKLYRQPLDLVINAPDSSEVKRYEINPLYEDLHMELDLSFLHKGEYTAVLSTTGFSKYVPLRID